jgi:hypothetical protein
MQRLLVTAILVFSLGTAAIAQPAGHCTRETLTVRGTPVTASYCVDSSAPGQSGHETAVAVTETYAAPHGSFTGNSTLHFIAGLDPSRVIEDVALDRLGLTGTLHLTLVLRNGLIHIESAMLTPGAITIK